MRLTRLQPGHERRISSRAVLDQDPIEHPSDELQALMKARLFQVLDEAVRSPRPIVLIPLLENLSKTYWVGALDPNFGEALEKRTDLRAHLLQQLSQAEEEFARVAGLTENEREDLPNDPIELESELTELASRIVQIFPDEREFAFEDFTNERLERLLKWAKIPGTISLQAASTAYELITIWPQERKRILETLFPPSELEPEKLITYFTPYVPPTPKPPSGRTVIRRPRSKDGDLGMFLILFPELRGVLEKQIDQRKTKLKERIQSIGSTLLLMDQFIAAEHELLILSAQTAELNTEGRLQMSLQKAVGKRPLKLPDRPLA